MPVSELCNREVVIVQRSSTVQEAAQLMREHHVGDLVVVEKHDGAQMPVGVVTDRDLVLEVMAPEIDQKSITVGDLVGPRLAAVKESTGVFESIQYMRAQGVRRLPVVDDQGALIGILTMDDVLELLSEELLELVKVVRHEQKKESMYRR
ncbi:MAG TPA: CBS domain-containing protein [Gallionellaceae bacterium]